MTMSKCRIILIVTVILVLAHQSKGQNARHFSNDTLVFQKISNSSQRFEIPLNDYSVFIKKINGKKKQVIITSYTDSTLHVKAYSFNKGEERKEKRKRLASVYTDTTLTATHIDSLTKLVMYSVHDTIDISSIEKIVVYNGNRSSMKRVLKITEWSAVTWLLVGIPALALFQSAAYFVVWTAVGVTIVVVSLITENKKIKFSKWEILK